MRRNQGFTLVETLVGVVVMCILGAAMATLIQVSTNANQSLMSDNAQIASARRAIYLVVDPLRGGSVTAAHTTSLSYTYIAADGNHTRTAQTMTDAVTGRRFLQVTDNGQVMRSGYIQDVSFLYRTYDKSSATWSTSYTNEPADPTTVGYVKVIVTIALQDGGTRTFTSTVLLRLSIMPV